MREVLRIALFAGAHLVLALASAVAAEGWDMDQLRSRSSVSSAAGVVHDILMYPHDEAMRAIPNAWLVRHSGIIPLAFLANSLLWGIACWSVWWGAGIARRRESG